MKDGLNFKDSATITKVTDSNTRMVSNPEYIGRVSVWKNGEKIVNNKRNLIVETGKKWIAKRLQDGTGGKITKIGIGTGGGAPVAGDTGLTSIISTQISPEGGTVADKTTTYTGTFDADQNERILKEIGLFAGAVMISRLLINFTKGANDKIIIEWILEPV